MKLFVVYFRRGTSIFLFIVCLNYCSHLISVTRKKVLTGYIRTENSDLGPVVQR